MILLTHILIALSSVIFASYMLFSPSHKKLTISYTLVGLTVASGTVLVVTTPGHMIQACVSGLVYVSVIMIMNVAAHRKLSRVTI